MNILVVITFSPQFLFIQLGLIQCCLLLLEPDPGAWRCGLWRSKDARCSLMTSLLPPLSAWFMPISTSQLFNWRLERCSMQTRGHNLKDFQSWYQIWSQLKYQLALVLASSDHLLLAEHFFGLVTKFGTSSENLLNYRFRKASSWFGGAINFPHFLFVVEMVNKQMMKEASIVLSIMNLLFGFLSL